MLDLMRNTLKKRKEESGEVGIVVWILMIVVGLALVGLVWQFVVPAFSGQAEEIGTCIEEGGNSNSC